MSGEKERERRWRLAVETFRGGDKAGALYLFKLLAKEGSLAALTEIGNIYELGGGGVEQDFEKALSWYRRSVNEADDIDGCLGLARLYYLGRGVERDFRRAFRYYSMLQDGEEPIALLMLGRMYQFGEGVEKDDDRAREYYKRAIKKGNVYAVKSLGLLELRRRDYLKGTFLIAKGTIITFVIAAKNINDPRLKSC